MGAKSCSNIEYFWRLLDGVHSYALAASALHTPLNCHPTLTGTPVSLSVGFSSIALVPLSMTPRSLPTRLLRTKVMQGEGTKQQPSGPDDVAYLGRRTVQQRMRGNHVTLLAAIEGLGTEQREHPCSQRSRRSTPIMASTASIHQYIDTRQRALMDRCVQLRTI
jgi:hypothetical protein